MPELAEVEFYRKQWDVGLGCVVTSLEVNRSKRLFRGVSIDAMLTQLVGKRLEGSATHGKQMCFFFTGGIHLGVHLGMTGKLRHEAPETFSRFKHDHLVLHMEEGQVLVLSDPRMFGRVQYASEVPDWWQGLPPEILSEAFTFDRMHTFFERRSRTVIKSALLMQEMFPGIGNWMADEILWRSRIHPGVRAGELDRSRRELLYRHIIEVSRDAMRVIGTDWGTPPDTWLFNHRWRDGGRCPETGGELIREPIGGRTTCWSPKWQS